MFSTATATACRRAMNGGRMMRAATAAAAAPPRRTLAAAAAAGAGGHHTPAPQSATAKLWQGHHGNEGWEFTMTWWYTSSAVLLLLVLAGAPETRIQAWAQHEARVRLENGASADAAEFGRHYSSHDEAQSNFWDQFSTKAMIQTEVDDDDEEEDNDEDDDDDDDE